MTTVSRPLPLSVRVLIAPTQFWLSAMKFALFGCVIQLPTRSGVVWTEWRNNAETATVGPATVPFHYCASLAFVAFFMPNTFTTRIVTEEMLHICKPTPPFRSSFVINSRLARYTSCYLIGMLHPHSPSPQNVTLLDSICSACFHAYHSSAYTICAVVFKSLLTNSTRLCRLGLTFLGVCFLSRH